MKKEEKKNKITMNLPNKLTILRILLVPVIVVVYGMGSQYEGVFAKPVIPFIPNLSLLNLIVMIIFGVAAFTDYLDGAIARKRGIVTNFGKFADPLADKLLVYSVFASLNVYTNVPLTYDLNTLPSLTTAIWNHLFNAPLVY